MSHLMILLLSPPYRVSQPIMQLLLTKVDDAVHTFGTITTLYPRLICTLTGYVHFFQDNQTTKNNYKDLLNLFLAEIFLLC